VRSRWIAIAIGLAALATFAIVRISEAGPADPSSAMSKLMTEHQIEESLTCQCGCGLTIANCNHPNCSFAVPMRKKIREMVNQGMGRVQIIAFFEHKYGEKILSAPTTQGFNLLAWVMPFIAIAAGCGLILFTVGRWRSASTSAPEAPARPKDGPEFDPKLRDKLEQEVREKI
jgi:cytochrome c-type biogenesis protein CcmH